MRLVLVFGIAVIVQKCSNVLVSSNVSSHLHIVGSNGKDIILCNWIVGLHCNGGLLINVKDVTISTYECGGSGCKCSLHLPGSGAINVVTNGNISQTIYDACNNLTTCNTTLPAPTDVAKGVITNVTVNYGCTGVPTTTPSVRESTISSTSGQETTVNDQSPSTTVAIQSPSSSSSILSTTHINTTIETGDEVNTTQSTSISATSMNAPTGNGRPDSSTSVENGTRTSPGSTVIGQSDPTNIGPATELTRFDPKDSRKDPRKQKTLLTAVLATVPTIIVVAVITITAIICIRRKRRDQYPDDKTAVLSASRNASTTDSSDDDNADSHPDPAGTSHTNNTYDLNGGYTPADYSEIEITGDTNDSSEYNTIDLETFKVVAADPTYNHIGISSSLGTMSASSNGGPTMAEDTDGCTCGETETVLVDNDYSHISKGFTENGKSNVYVQIGTSNYDHVNSFTGAVADDGTYSHIFADKEDIRGKAIVQDVDNYSHVSHVAKSAEGSESQWQMQVGDDNAVSSNEGAQVLQAVSEIERDDNPDDGKTSYAEADTHSYFILEKQFS